jgi:hypothetical protein
MKSFATLTFLNIKTMNTTEHLVEIYYRQKNYFTISDIKVINGNNRQFDLLAYDVIEKLFYHIEIGVTHTKGWQSSLEDLKDNIRYKFFGCVRNTRPDNSNTDYKKEKNYIKSIKSTYQKFGVDYKKVIRVWCAWSLEATENEISTWKKELSQEFNINKKRFQILLFRDSVLPFLLESVGTANYDDKLYRTLSLVKEYNRQKNQK